MMSPRWPKAWYGEGAALSMLKDYKGAVDALGQALKLDPASDEIKKALSALLLTRNNRTLELLWQLAYLSIAAL
ncbi:hypothetical protein PVAP13_3KG530701 [Panicum virgatum]|uniref:Tetratricopeptide repeat protein n=1 Tax=Panicum virgatum TaxID=38727 RepID=A0A8T0V250_PANVG|nr:hypothetical protein PVAP13_3KG530701 [Panicum virgatum]